MIVITFPQDPTKCPHKIVEYKWLDESCYYLYCMACGEKIADNEIVEDKRKVTGVPRKLNSKERKMLR